jgi:pilus assembly protein CpaE
MPDIPTLRMAVVSADPTFRSAVAEVLQSHADMATVVADLSMSASSLNAAAIDRVQADNPEVVLVDLNGDPADGIRMVRLLGDAAPTRTLIATGPALAPELLLDGMKAGIAEYLPSPVNAHDLADALRRAARRLGRGSKYGHSAAGRIITFVGAKGGTGVTTTAANAAVQLHHDKPGRTLLVDLNLEGGNLAVAMGLRPRYSIVDLFENFHRVDESLLSSLVIQHSTGVQVLAAPLLPESVPAISADQTRAALRLLRRHYDLIVIDLARPYMEYGRATLDSSDSVFLMLIPDVLAIHGAKRLLPLIHKGVQSRDGHVEIVLNRVSGEDEVGQSDVAEALNVPVHHLLRRDDAAVLSSLNLGRPVTMNGGRSRYAKDVKALCVRLAAQNKPGAAPGRMSTLLRGFGRRSSNKGTT